MHIIPDCKRSCYEQLKSAGFTYDDVDSVRNALFLVDGIEKAFDKLWVGFVKNPNVLIDGLVMKVFNQDRCKDLILCNGSTEFVTEYDGRPLLLGNHTPLKTALFLHSYSAYLKFGASAPAFWISPEKSTEFSDQIKIHLESIDAAALE